MTTFPTPRQLAERTSSAVDAAVAAGRDLGLTVTDPVVLHDLFSVVVHLAPAPVVARVPVIAPPSADPAAVTLRQQAELDVTHWLAQRGVPVLAPSPLTPREPVRRNGFSMTFWAFVEPGDARPPDYLANAERVADLHAALRDYPGPLTFLSAAEPWFVTDALDRLARHPELIDPADRDRAIRQWRVLEPLTRSPSAFEARFPGVDLQPVHGDCPPANIFHGVDGDRYADFELVTLGPVEWDLATLGPEYEAAYDRGARRTGLRPLDGAVMEFVTAVGMLRAVATLALVPQLPQLAEYLRPAVDRWRTTPFTGDVDDSR